MNQIFLGSGPTALPPRGDLLRQAAEGRERGRGRDAGRPAQGAVGLQPDRPTRKRATLRQRYIIDRMLDNGFITEQHDEAPRPRSCATARPADASVHAEYVAETARQLVLRSTARPPTRAGLNVYVHPSTRPTRWWPTARCAAACWTSSCGRSTAAPRPLSTCRPTPAALDARIAEALADHPDNDDCAPPWCWRPRRRKVVAVLQSGESITVTGDGLKPVTSGLAEKAPQNIQIRRGAVVRRLQERQGRLAADAVARGRGRLRRAGSAHRRHPRPGGRLRLRQEQVQPRHAGLAPAGLQLQALHLLGGAGKGLHARHRGQRRAAVLRRRHHRQPALGAEELRRQVRRPDAAEDRPWRSRRTWCRSGAAVHRAAVRAGMGHALRLRCRQASRPT
jgi:hypothetical protein